MTGHIVPIRTYFAVTAALFILLALTIIAAKIHLGPITIVVAMAIAIAKAILIVLFFMHVRHGSGLTKIFVVSGFLWLAILMGAVISDVFTR